MEGTQEKVGDTFTVGNRVGGGRRYERLRKGGREGEGAECGKERKGGKYGRGERGAGRHKTLGDNNQG